MIDPACDPPEHAYWAASFANKILESYRATGGTDADLFSVFAGIVSARDKQV
jgi:hypothetical protein